MSHKGQRGAADFPNRDVAQFLLAGTRLFNVLAGPVNGLVPADALESGEIAALNRLQQWILQTVGSIEALSFRVALHAGTALHVADGLVGFGSLATGYVARRGQRQQSTIFDMRLEHALPVTVNFVIRVDHLDALFERFGRLSAEHIQIFGSQGARPDGQR